VSAPTNDQRPTTNDFRLSTFDFRLSTFDLKKRMPDLIAQGPQPEQRWRRKLQAGMPEIVGRQAGDWSTPWDDRVSRRHVEVIYRDGRLRVDALPGAKNPVFFRGYKSDSFVLRPGDHFVIGQTTFSLVDERAHASLDLPRPVGERTFSVEELHRQPFREADKRIDVLSRLPEVISGSASDQELLVRLVNLLLSGVEQATAAAVVSATDSPSEPVKVLHWDRRILAGMDFRPSERLIRQATTSGQSIVHVWSARFAPGEVSHDATARPTDGPFTLSEGVDWAFCTPAAGGAAPGWSLYVTGSFSVDVASDPPDAEALRDDVKFAELMATTLSSLREARLLATRQASLSPFFSPVVLKVLGSQDPDEVLAPREADVTVLFCDLRGFTRESERSAGDLMGLLHRVSQALGVMTHHILGQEGVVGDFHGDAAMGFWGWPIGQPDAVERACRAALGIRTAFTETPCADDESQPASQSNLGEFRVGIGVASGRAVAGKIGTIDQVKVTVFGPVVNLASRLETMTRHLRASILIDPPTAAVIRASIGPDVCRVRRLAKVRPVGLSSPVEVSELLPPAPDCPELTDADLAAYEAALSAFEARDWPQALRRLHEVPPDDQAKDFLTLFITQHGRLPPPNWDGSIPLEVK
jgi:adenylate cyclase